MASDIADCKLFNLLCIASPRLDCKLRAILRRKTFRLDKSPQNDAAFADTVVREDQTEKFRSLAFEQIRRSRPE